MIGEGRLNIEHLRRCLKEAHGVRSAWLLVKGVLVNMARRKKWCSVQKVRSGVLFATLLLLVAFGSGPPALAQAYEPDELIIAVDPKMKSYVEQRIQDRYAGLLFGTPEHKQLHAMEFIVGGQPKLVVALYRARAGKLDQFEQDVKGEPGVLAVQRNYYGFFMGSDARSSSPADSPSDPFFPSQWHHSAIHSLSAWKKIGDKSGAAIAVLDSGTGQKDISALAMYGGVLYVNSSISGHDSNMYGHGSRITHLAAATGWNGIGGIGVSPKAKIYSFRLCESPGLRVKELDLINGIRRNMTIPTPARIINLSVNCLQPDLAYANKTVHPVLHKVMEIYHNDFGGLIFNSSPSSGAGSSPISPYLIVVGGLKQDNNPLQPDGPSVWFEAPAENIWAPTGEGTPTAKTGTSYAAPIVAGIASLVWGANPGLTNVEVEQILKDSSAHPKSRTVAGAGRPVQYGFGLPDAGKAVELAQSARRR